ncbi:MAG: BirA family biotin operon repressor/biotin-[acetyl-CoA-carboxylase] ligase [Verrucomicrobiales bacterium]|jgi:BirA family biotin operon repressor/biotin-[acetyl-CoA-carboxylase] ligase
MRSGRFGSVKWVASTGSTNDDLTAIAEREPNVAEVLTADLQTTGRGRRGRTWDMTPGGGLLISFYVPWTATESAHLVPTALGVAAVDAVGRLGRPIGLKWPNDLVVADGRKLGGMLGNTVWVDGALSGVVVGLGCNVSWPPEGEDGLEQAISLDRLGPEPIDRTQFATELISFFDSELDRLSTSSVSLLHDRYRDRCFTLGKSVRIEGTSGGHVTGVATDIDPSGALLVDVDGVQRRVDVGDVVHLRPA